MAIANPHETLLRYKLQKNALNFEIEKLQSQKNDSIAKQADRKIIEAQEQSGVREYFRALYKGDDEYQLKYKDYTEIPDFEEEMNKIAANSTEELAQLTYWETVIDDQILVDSTQVEEITAYMESIKQVLQSNIQEDFNYGLNQ